MFESFLSLVKELYPNKKNIPLHEPSFSSNERKYVEEAISSTFVSSVGQHVNQFEEKIAEYIGVKHAIATVNGTSALHASLVIMGVERGDEVLTQSLNFVASCNAIKYCNADPIFIDVATNSLGMCPKSLERYLDNNAIMRKGRAYNKITNKLIKACLPMHTFGFPVDIVSIQSICKKWNISLIEDAAEGLGSFCNGRHVGTFGDIGILSFNGNKVITTGGGGMILTDSDILAKQLKHITTTAKVGHKWNFYHDILGYNYRMPNINAALGLGQLEGLDRKLSSKRNIFNKYKTWSDMNGQYLFNCSENSDPNFWLNTLILDDADHKEAFLEYTNKNKIATRPAWIPMHHLPMYKGYVSDSLINTDYLFDRLVNIPSSPILG